MPRREVLGEGLLALGSAAAGLAWVGIAAAVTGRPDAYAATEAAWRRLWMPDRTGIVPVQPWVFLPAVRRLGPLVRLWLAAYALFLLGAFFPQSSVFRLLMPMVPLAGALVPARRAGRVALLAGSLVLQALWLWVVCGPMETYWSVP